MVFFFFSIKSFNSFYLPIKTVLIAWMLNIFLNYHIPIRLTVCFRYVIENYYCNYYFTPFACFISILVFLSEHSMKNKCDIITEVETNGVGDNKR